MTSSSVSAARQIQRQEVQPFSTRGRCTSCDKVLSIAEEIENHCEGCAGQPVKAGRK